MKRLFTALLLVLFTITFFASCAEEEIAPKNTTGHTSGDGSVIRETGGF
ncbi:hypothetical protein [Fulvivirga ligni]|nr:hypothetical protein [Fulvivirga ligni]UII23508.1 hypothetical protein LVD16_09735 [Fulvivirga ligni]UII23509.1 hypothetical protein LVD16_09740 [Fulvivirga ligni]